MFYLFLYDPVVMFYPVLYDPVVMFYPSLYDPVLVFLRFMIRAVLNCFGCGTPTTFTISNNQHVTIQNQWRRKGG